ncbi:MAG: U32 family peptidase [Ruminococcus sp.]|jgi:collagenase-like PrtC family protease|nr:U32 family peptidase [Ruminococcus sp.]
MNLENQNKNTELLSPAGNISAFKSAAEGGADAVYVGLQKFSARGNADNFTLEMLKDLRQQVKSDLKIYVALNTLIFDNELREFENIVKELSKLGIDAVILQDIGAVSIAKKYGLNIHASTQMTVHSVYGCDFLKSIGFKRVVLARELPYSSLKKISDHCRKISLETEIFVQGAQCFSVSGQCFMSAMFGGLSANRGFCASACRLPFKNVVGSEKVSNSHCLSMRDLCLISHINDIKKIGISSIKIEGRMKSAEYVLETAKAFRNALSGDEFDKDRSVKKLQEVSVQRGFSDNFFTGKTPTAANNSSFAKAERLKPKFPDEKILNSIKLPLRIDIDKLTDLKSADLKNFEYIILPMLECENVENLNPNKIIIKPPRLDFDEEKTFKRLGLLKDKGFSHLLVNNLSYIKIADELKFKLHGDFGLNVTNSNSAEFLKAQNFQDITLSFEMRKEKINALCKNLKVGIIGYGQLPLMLSKTCPIANCKNCNHKITDRKNKTFFVNCKGGYVEIYNSDNLDVLDRLSEFDIDFVTILPNYKTANSNAKTNGLYFRSVK